MARKFYRSILTVIILSEDKPAEYEDLQDLHREIEGGPYVGVYGRPAVQEISERQMIRELEAAGSSSDFFNIEKPIKPSQKGSVNGIHSRPAKAVRKSRTRA